MDYIQLGLLIADLVASIGAILAVWIARKTFLADHERRKKQSTIEFYHTISNGAGLPLRDLIHKVYGSLTTITPNDEKYKETPELREKTRSYFRNMERLAVGINCGIYDFEVFYRLSGEPTVQLFKALLPLIEDRRKATDAVTFCIEFEKLCSELSKRKQMGERDYYAKNKKRVGVYIIHDENKWLLSTKCHSNLCKSGKSAYFVLQ
jgi:hypothetical protein